MSSAEILVTKFSDENSPKVMLVTDLTILLHLHGFVTNINLPFLEGIRIILLIEYNCCLFMTSRIEYVQRSD